MRKRTFRYEKSDFRPLPLVLDHMDIRLKFENERVLGENTLHVTAREPLSRVTLNARDLDIRAVDVDGVPLVASRGYRYRKEAAELEVLLPGDMDRGQSFSIHTSTVCYPSDRLLEGIYRDTTPPGCPPQFMSQCQQWGFQRILPVFDDCTAKCTMTTQLTADARYTHLVSNGNVCRNANPDGQPVRCADNPSLQAVTYRNPVKMAPYLFLACAGTWDVVEDRVVYPSGRIVKLEYLVPPGRSDGARIPMRILKDAILWLHASQEYEYPYDVYRTICMEKSNFGGMENVGNTTILTSAALIDAYTNDVRLEYAHGVIVHEFEHNQCGSDVTMETPFDMWLNEAFTVDVERSFLRTRFDPDGVRLAEVDSMRSAVSGPLAIEDGGHLGNIVRSGFNDPDELVDGVTYVKAAEVIRMLRQILGDDRFRRGKNLYFERFSGGNANTDQFFACFEEVSGVDLGPFKREWLYTIGYPRVEVSYEYSADTRELHLTLKQQRSGKGGCFHIPLEMAVVDAMGEDVPGTQRTLQLTGERMEIAFDDVPPPAFVSLNRNCSFYGTLEDVSGTPQQLIRQIRMDPNLFNRVEAMRRLTDLERVRLIHNPHAPIGEIWLSAFGRLLEDVDLPPGIRACQLRIDEQSLNRAYLPAYRERYAARQRLLRAAAARHRGKLMDAFRAVDTTTAQTDPVRGIENRALKGVLLRILIAADDAETHALAARHFREAWNITDQMTALRCIQISSHPQRRELMEEGFRMWKDHLAAYTGYLALVGCGVGPDVFDMLAREEARDAFRIEHPSHSRALFLPVTANNKMLWTDTGLAWLTETVVRLAAINENTAIRLLSALQQVDRMADDLRSSVRSVLREMAERMPDSAPSVVGRLRAFLGGRGPAASVPDG